MKKLLTILAISAVLISSFSLLATAQNSDNEITLGDSNWPGLRGKNAIVNYILENIGYEVKRTSATDPMLRQGIINGDIDIYLGTWMPSLQEARTKNQDKQHLVTKNMHNGLLGMAVPKYVAEKGVTSLEDLQEHADKFDKKLYVGPAGWASEKTMNKAIENDIYNLGDWETVNSSQSAMMAQVEKSINNEEFIIFVGWRPHWMNTKFDIKYLNDPERLWKSPYSWVDTLVRKGFEEDYPQAYRFLQQFRVDVEANDKWIYEIGYNESDPNKVAKEWIKSNITEVRRWLSMVETVDGKNAYQNLIDDLNI